MAVPPPPVRAAIFDMDGLLVDSEPIWSAVTRELMAELGADVATVLDTGLTKGMRVDESIALFRTLAPFPGAGDPEAEAALAQRIVRGVAMAITAGAQLMPGALGALDRLADAGLVLALASGSVPAVIDAVVDRFALRERFAVIRSASGVPLGKPHPEVFLETAAALGLPPAACAVIEDSLNGCIAAKAAQMRVIAVPAPAERDDPRFALADIVLDSLEAIGSPEVAELLGVATHR